MLPVNAAALVLAGMSSVLLYPMVARALLARARAAATTAGEVPGRPDWPAACGWARPNSSPVTRCRQRRQTSMTKRSIPPPATARPGRHTTATTRVPGWPRPTRDTDLNAPQGSATLRFTEDVRLPLVTDIASQRCAAAPGVSPLDQSDQAPAHHRELK
jgi:hypothetical protein